MSSAERPEADAAEQARAISDDPQDQPLDGDIGPELDAAIADVLDQMRDAGLPDEDEAPYPG